MITAVELLLVEKNPPTSNTKSGQNNRKCSHRFKRLHLSIANKVFSCSAIGKKGKSHSSTQGWRRARRIKGGALQTAKWEASKRRGHCVVVVEAEKLDGGGQGCWRINRMITMRHLCGTITSTAWQGVTTTFWHIGYCQTHATHLLSSAVWDASRSQQPVDTRHPPNSKSVNDNRMCTTILSRFYSTILVDCLCFIQIQFSSFDHVFLGCPKTRIHRHTLGHSVDETNKNWSTAHIVLESQL